MRTYIVYAACAIALVAAVIVAAMLGSGSPRQAPGAHALYFAADSSRCPLPPGTRYNLCRTIYRIDADELAAHAGSSMLMAAARPIVDVPYGVAELGFTRSAPARLLYLARRNAPASVDDKLDLWSVAPDGSDPRLVRASVITLGDLDTPEYLPVPLPGAAEIRVKVTGQPGALGIRVASPDGALYAWLFTGIDSQWLCVGGPDLSINASIQDGGVCLVENFYTIPVWAPQ